MKRIIGLIAGISGLILTIFGGIFIFSILGAASGSSVGIIGGADGPTAVFIASRSGMLPYVMTGFAVLGIALLVVALVLLLRKKK